jgi:signal transduction histidine kinase
MLILCIDNFLCRAGQEICWLTLDCSVALPLTFADRDCTQQILINLITNALNYALEGKRSDFCKL